MSVLIFLANFQFSHLNRQPKSCFIASQTIIEGLSGVPVCGARKQGEPLHKFSDFLDRILFYAKTSFASKDNLKLMRKKLSEKKIREKYYLHTN